MGFWLIFVPFLSSLHWPSTVDDLGVGGVLFVELLILYERWAGERLVLEMSVPKSRRLHRSISVSVVPDGPSIDIWRSCRFLGAIIRALANLPGGLGRFLPCRFGANHCRLRSIGWERCGHGLTSRPLEVSDAGFLDELLFLFGYPIGSGQSLVDDSLRMRYCSANFSCKKPTWRLPHSGGVATLVYAVLVLGTLETLKERGYDLPKRQMFVSVLGLIFGSSQFPNDGELTFFGMRFLLGKV